MNRSAVEKNSSAYTNFFKKNEDAFLSTIPYDNNKLIWPGGKRTQTNLTWLIKFLSDQNLLKLLKTLKDMEKTEQFTTVALLKTETEQIE